MLLFVFALLVLERALRGTRRFHHTTGKYRRLPEERLEGPRGALAALACALPVLFGFVLPAGVLLHDALRTCGGGAGAGVLAGRVEQPSARRRGRDSCGRLRRGAGLCAAADALETGSGRKHASRHQLRRARHRACHRPPHSARRLRQFRRLLGRSLFGVLYGIAAVRNRLRHRARLHHPLPCRVARRGGGGPEQGVPQHRCRCALARCHARRDAVQGASALCSGPRSEPPHSSSSSIR